MNADDFLTESLLYPLTKAGEKEGHEFRGNQYTGGKGGNGAAGAKKVPGRFESRNRFGTDEYSRTQLAKPPSRFSPGSIAATIFHKLPEGVKTHIPHRDHDKGVQAHSFRPEPHPIENPGAAAREARSTRTRSARRNNSPQAQKQRQEHNVRMAQNIDRQLRAGEKPEIRRDNYPEFLRGLFEIDKRDNPLNIVNLRVKGTFLIGHGGKGIPREDMPQVDSGEPREQFTGWLLKNHGVEVDKTEMNPEELLPMQNEINGGKTASIFKKYTEAGGVIPGEERILVTRDGYVLDGHHNWSAALAMHMENPNVKIPVYVINTTWDKAYQLAWKWDIENGVKGQSMTAEKPPRPEKKVKKDANPFDTDLLLEGQGIYHR